jgi:small-conductance mechanosensitive channel
VLRLLRLLATVLGALVCLQVAFTFYPLTRGYALTLLAFVVDPLTSLWRGFLSSISDLIAAAVLIVLVFYGLKALRWMFTAVADGTVEVPGIAREWALPMYKLLRIVVIALAVVMVFPYIPGSGTQAFRGVSLFAGALFTLGATGTVGNFIGGLVVMFVRAFRLGDFVTIGEVTGEVIDTTLVLTRIRTIKNEIVTVPNAAILSTQVKNYSAEARDGGVILHTSVTIGYDAPWRTVEGLLLEAASRTPLVEKTPAPFVLQTALNDFFITYEINVYTREPIQTPVIYSTLHQNIQDAFNAAGVEIMSPHFAALRDGNTTAIPEASRKGAETRKFEVRVEKSDG